MTAVSLQDVAEIVNSVWECVLQLEIEPTSPGHPWGHDARLTGSISIAGEWNGDVIVSASQLAASTAAARMFSLPLESVADVDLQDALAEITNIIGGNIKSLVPGPSRLGLPKVGTSEGCAQRDGKLIANLKCLSQDNLLQINVWENVNSVGTTIGK